MKYGVVIATVVLSALTAHAHEGHDKSGMQAINGGIVKPGEHLNIELVQDGPALKLFPLTHESTGMTLDSRNIKAFVKTEKRGKTQAISKELKLKPEGNYFLATPELKDVKHFKLEVKTTVNGKSDTFEFPVEQ